MPDPDGGGGNGDLAKIPSRMEALDARVVVIEKSKDFNNLVKRVASLEEAIKALDGLGELKDKLAGLELKIETLEIAEPKAATMPTIQSERQHLEAELAQLTKNPKNRITLLTKQNVKEKAAKQHVADRIDAIKEILATMPAKAAALILGLLLFAFAFNASADQQGQSSAIVPMTNLPAVVQGYQQAIGVTNLINPIGASAGLTNYIAFHRGAALSMDWNFNASTGAVNTNASLIFAPSANGTTPDTWQRWVFNAQAFGPTNVDATTNWNVNQLAGYKGMFLMEQTNGCGGGLTNNSLNFTVPQGGAGP